MDFVDMAAQPVPVAYTNWRGEAKELRLILSGALRFGTTEWHQQPTWLISGFDVDHPAQIWKEYDLTKMVFSVANQGRCAQYNPDIQAQLDCINCGQPWEDHQCR